jgi:hypothetical protein
VLWSGEDPALHEALLEELEASDIPYADKPIGEEANAPDPLPIDWKPRFGFQVAVHHSDLPKPRKSWRGSLARANLLMWSFPPRIQIKAKWRRLSLPVETAAGEEPSISVWAGNHPRVIEFLTAALRENEIPMRAVK